MMDILVWQARTCDVLWKMESDSEFLMWAEHPGQKLTVNCMGSVQQVPSLRNAWCVALGYSWFSAFVIRSGDPDFDFESHPVPGRLFIHPNFSVMFSHPVAVQRQVSRRRRPPLLQSSLAARLPLSCDLSWLDPFQPISMW